MLKIQVAHILQSHQEELQNRYAVKSLGLIGPVARNEAKSHSDVDLLIEFAKSKGLFQFLTGKNCLKDWLNQRVDLVTYYALKSPLKEQILKEVRAWHFRIDDILQALTGITDDIEELDYHGFINDRKTRHSVVRELEIVGEAACHIPLDIEALYPQIPWR